MEAGNRDQISYSIWQAKGIDYCQQNAHRYWMQLYQNFNLLNYLNFPQHVDIIEDLSSQDTIQYDGNIPMLINDKVFKVSNNDRYFLLRENRIPTLQELIYHQVKKIEDQEFKKKLNKQAEQIAKNGYYVTQKEDKRKKSFGIFIIEQYQQGMQFKFIRNKQNVKNSIIVSFDSISNNGLNNFKIQITLSKKLSPAEISFSSLFPDIQEMKRSLFQVPSNPKFRATEAAHYISYNYQEPKLERYKQFKGPHLALAFQGGGVKGVSYVGVYKQIIKLQQSVVQQCSERNIIFPIKSVIGSSAGGILSLAFTTGVNIDEMLQLCLMMDTFIQDLLIQTEEQGLQAQDKPDEQFNLKNVIPIEKGYFKKQVDNLKNVVHDLGLVEDRLFDILIQILKEPSIQDKLLKILIPLAGSSISSLITFKQQKQKRGDEWVCCCCGFACCCCKKNISDIKSLNYYGILYLALMSGQALENIVAYLLVLYLKKAVKLSQNNDFKIKFITFLKRKNYKGIQTITNVQTQAQNVLIQYQKYQIRKQEEKKKGFRLLKIDMIYPTLPLMKFAKTITLEQYYSLNEIEFTCTSVDLVDYVQRFFNHKTSPRLPVCKAVQMTGSFPIAFQSQRWKRQWGPYYVTYHNTRNQIDLTGHNFTDGGLLANFPIRFIDNQKFRPMYFSHKLNKDTVLYGFGLEQLADFPENIPQKQISDAISSFKKQFLIRLTPKLFKYLICCCSNGYYENTKFELIQFLFSLVTAMKLSDRKLNIQCFQPEIIKTKMPPQSGILKDRSKQKYLDKLQITLNALQQFKQVVNNHLMKNQTDFVKDQLCSLKQLVQQSQLSSGKAISTFKKIIESNLGEQGLFSSAFELYRRIHRNKNLNYKFETNGGLLLTNQFGKQINQCITSFESQIRTRLDKDPIRRNFDMWYESVEKSLQYIKTKIENNKEDSLQKLTFIQEQDLTNQVQTRYKFTPFLNKKHKQILGEKLKDAALKKISINSYVQHQTYKKINIILKRVRKTINQSIDLQLKQANEVQKQIVLHLILQAFSISHYYYPQIIEIVQTVLFQINTQRAIDNPRWKKLSVNILSCTDYQAIYGVFYALGMKTEQIKKKVSEISSLFQINKNLKQQFESQIWLKTSLSKLQTLVKREWQQRFDILQHIQEQQRLYPKEYQNQLNKSQINEDCVIKHKISGIQIQNYLQKVLDYVSSSFQELNKLQVSKRRDRIAQLLNLGKYKEMHQKYQKKGRRVILDIMSHLTDLFIVICHYIMKTEQYLYIRQMPITDDKFFKGMILQSMVSTLQYKKYIYTLLKQKAIDPSITLQKFYQIADRKVLLNFTCIKVNQGRFSFINKNSRPNMPLWAALMAAASLPYLQGSFPGRQQWQNNQSIKNQNQNQANIYFNKITKQDQNSNLISFISSNFISRLPIELLSNNRVIQDKLLNEKLNPNKKIIQLCFSFELQNQQKQRVDLKELVSRLCLAMKGKTKFVKCWDLCNYFCQFLCCCCCSLEGIDWYFSDMLNQMQLMKLISLRVDSNDNLIYHIYKNYLIKLPLRIGTLQFDKITNDKPYLKDTIRQAQQVVRQLTDVVVVRNNTIQFQQFAKNTTLELSYVTINNKNFYRFKFISFSVWRTLKSKYVIFYKVNQDNLNQQRPYTRIQHDYFQIPEANKNKYIYLKFIYCSPTYKIKSRVHKVQLSYLHFPLREQYRKQLKFLRAVFHFPFRNVLINDRQNLLNGKWVGLNQQEFESLIFPLNSDMSENQPLREQLLQIRSYTIPQISIVTEIQNKKGLFCTNPTCFPKKLNRVLNNQRTKGQCSLCKSKFNFIAMKCTVCFQQYCFHCKIENFIGIHKDPNLSTFERCCIQRHNLILIKNAHVQLCLYCDKYFMSVWKDEICNLTVCSSCLIYIPQVQVVDTLEDENSQDI